jgi:hypothetical protein
MPIYWPSSCSQEHYKLLPFTALARDGLVEPMRVLLEGWEVALFTEVPRRVILRSSPRTLSSKIRYLAYVPASLREGV